jgi:drug/metabolite transporter (DMT)-like permease
MSYTILSCTSLRIIKRKIIQKKQILTGLGCFAAMWVNVYGISVIGASATGSYIYTQPVFAAILAIFLMGEHLTVYKIISAVLIFIGVYLVNLKKLTE